MTVNHLYIHVPFCPSKCSYCAFVTHIGSRKLVPAYVRAVCTEMRRVAGTRAGGPLDTVYFGGGTPSMLEPGEVAAILGEARRSFGLSSGCEITLEMHPSTVNARNLAGFRDAGVTRMSVGGESLVDRELLRIGRTHGRTGVLEAIRLGREAGFASIGLDLIYGLPEQSLESWGHTLRTALGAGADHLSLYPLSIEPRTVFARRQREGALLIPADDAVAEMYSLACQILGCAQFEHYEVANWAADGHRCRHNVGYWRNEEYYGIGVGAHGYLRPFRTEHVRQTGRYIELVENGSDPVFCRTTIDRDTELAETIMLGLRLLQDGIDCDDIQHRFGVDLLATHRRKIGELRSNGLLRLSGRRLTLPESAVLLANEAWSVFM